MSIFQVFPCTMQIALFWPAGAEHWRVRNTGCPQKMSPK
jgi:hypothetical protein